MDDRIRARRQAVAAASVRRRRRALVSAASVIALVAAAAALATTPLFDVETVEVVGVDDARSRQVQAVAAVVPGQNLLRVDRDAVTRAVTSLPWVASVDVRRIPPATLRIHVVPRQPAAVVRIQDASWMVDPTGVVMAGGDREGLPVIDAPDSVVPPPGATVSDAAIRNALAVRAALPPALRATVDRYEATSDRALRLRMILGESDAPTGPPDVDLSAVPGAGADVGVSAQPTTAPAAGDQADAVWVRFGTADRADAKVRAIELLLSQARMQASRQGAASLGIAELDVRAPNNPVLVPRA